MAIFKSSNHNPSLSEIDLNLENEFNCQVNTSGENVRAYKLQILSGRGDEVICDGLAYTDSLGNTIENAGTNCNPVKNKGFLKIPNISKNSVTVLPGKELKNGKDYQWGIRTYGAPIGSKELPRTMVCEGCLVGSTLYVIWVNMDEATEKDKKVANDNLQYNRYIEFNIPQDSITDSILPFSENYNNSNNLKYPPEPNTSDPNAITDTSEENTEDTENTENAEPSSQAEEGDTNTEGEGTGSTDTESTEEKKEEKTLYVKRKKINWVEKELGESKNITKIECEDSFEYNYKDGVSFDIYLCSDLHTPNSVFIDPNDLIELSNFIVIYENKKDYDAAIKAEETPATDNPTVTPRNKATKIYGYSSDTGEVRVRDPFDPVPVNGNYYRIFEYDIVNKTYKEKTSGTSGKKQIVGGSPILNALFKVYSNKWTGINGDEENRLFIQPNVNIKTDPTNPNEIVFEDKTRIDINLVLDKETYPGKTVDITFDKLDNTQWLLKGKAFSVVLDSGSTISLGTESYPLPKTNYTVYTDFMDSAPYSVFYARNTPTLDISYTDLNRKSSSLEKDEYINYRDIYFRTPWIYKKDDSEWEVPKLDVKYYHYKIYDENDTLIGESLDIYSTELFEITPNEKYVNTLDWGFKGLESGVDKDHPKCYTVKLIVTDEYEKEFEASTELKVYYNSFKDYLPLDVKTVCKEQAIQVSTKVPHCADTIDYLDSKTVDESNVVGNALEIPERKILNYTKTKTIDGRESPIIIPLNISLLTKILVRNDFIKSINDGEDKEIIRFGNKRYIDKEKYVIDEYSLRVGNFNGFYKINKDTVNEQYVKNDKQLKFTWYKNKGENETEVWETIRCFNNGKDNYKDIRDIDFKNFKFQGITTLKYNLLEADNIKMIGISANDFIDFIEHGYDESKPLNFVNQLLTNKVNIKRTSRILLKDVYDDRGNKLNKNYFHSGIYVYNSSEEINKWLHDLTIAYIYADTLDYFSSNTGVTIESLGIPKNCIETNKENENILIWKETNNVWVDNDYEEEIEKINQELFDNSWFVIYFIIDKGNYKCEIRLQDK